MIAIGTNVLVRLVVADDPEQARRARISAALRGVLGLDRVTSDAPAVVARALEWFDAGIDLADALHVASAAHASQFATFDRQLVQRAKRAGIPRVEAVAR